MGNEADNKFTWVIKDFSSLKSEHKYSDQFVVDYPDMNPFFKLYDKDDGFLVNGDLKIVVEIDVLEVIRRLDVSVKSREVTKLLKKIKLNDNDAAESKDMRKETSSAKESIDVNGFKCFLHR
ncbi:unnamed protein product [Arabis nemorensis]|uniref:MATH domain-containing protein n=1 Tax=Arabis nemorensis TaxID=586526 RepID=A0A565AVE0_9BRAS|nr:unnamed protein product [Arabis nemorensis]